MKSIFKIGTGYGKDIVNKLKTITLFKARYRNRPNINVRSIW